MEEQVIYCPRCQEWKESKAFFKCEEGRICGDCYDKMIEFDHGITE